MKTNIEKDTVAVWSWTTEDAATPTAKRENYETNERKEK
jgi:hypothetical protein